MTTITIYSMTPRLDVPAHCDEKHVRGVWAAHLDVHDGVLMGPRWTVTHVPTGGSLRKDMTQAQAEALLAKLPETFAAECAYGPEGARKLCEHTGATRVAKLAESV